MWTMEVVKRCELRPHACIPAIYLGCFYVLTYTADHDSHMSMIAAFFLFFERLPRTSPNAMRFSTPPSAIFVWRSGRSSDRNWPALLYVYRQTATRASRTSSIVSQTHFWTLLCEIKLLTESSCSSRNSILLFSFSVQYTA